MNFKGLNVEPRSLPVYQCLQTHLLAYVEGNLYLFSLNLKTKKQSDRHKTYFFFPSYIIFSVIFPALQDSLLPMFFVFHIKDFLV